MRRAASTSCCWATPTVRGFLENGVTRRQAGVSALSRYFDDAARRCRSSLVFGRQGVFNCTKHRIWESRSAARSGSDWFAVFEVARSFSQNPRGLRVRPLQIGRTIVKLGRQTGYNRRAGGQGAGYLCSFRHINPQLTNPNFGTPLNNGGRDMNVTGIT